MTANIYDFDAYLRHQLEPSKGTLGEVARHKLLYATNRVSISKCGDPAFAGRWEAWKLGPVFVSLWKNPTRGLGDERRLTKQQRGFCDLVARVLGTQSGRSLAARSHAKYYEWHEARRNRSNQEITVEAIRKQLSLVTQ